MGTTHRLSYLAEVNKKYGAGTLVLLKEQPNVLRCSTGIADLDIALGGGIPMGRFTMIWGPRSAGKTTLAGLTIANAQKLCRHDGKRLHDGSMDGDEDYSQLPIKPLYFDPKGKEVEKSEAIEMVEIVGPDMAAIKSPKLKPGHTQTNYQEPMFTVLVNQEGTVDPNWIAQLGVNANLVYCLNTDTAEQTIDIVDSMIRERFVDFVVLDSIAAMTPLVETEASTESSQVGLQARLVNKMLRVWVASLQSYRAEEVRPTILLINQVRYKVGKAAMFGNPEVKPGGVGQDFATACEIQLRQGSPNKKTDYAPDEDGGYLMFSRTNFRVLKNKTYPPHTVGQYLVSISPHDSYEPGCVIQERIILERAKLCGLFVQPKKGKKWVLGEHEFATQKAALKWAKESPNEFSDFVRMFVDLLVTTNSGIPRS